MGLGRAATVTLFATLLLIITRQPLPNKNQFYQLLLVGRGNIGCPVFSALVISFPFITIDTGTSVLLLNETIDRITILFALLVVSIVAIGKRMPITQKI